jgi:hypothetical protein
MVPLAAKKPTQIFIVDFSSLLSQFALGFRLESVGLGAQ